jgi:hypothetical protein
MLECFVYYLSKGRIVPPDTPLHLHPPTTFTSSINNTSMSDDMDSDIDNSYEVQDVRTSERWPGFCPLLL